MGRGGALVVEAFRPEGRGFKSRSNRHVGTLSKSLTCSCLWPFVSVLCRERSGAVAVLEEAL